MADAIIQFETDLQTLLNNSVDIFTVSINGTQFSPNLDTITASSEASCPDGTELDNNLCGSALF